MEVTDGRTGEMRVSLGTYGWFPDAVPAAEEEVGENAVENEEQ